MNNCSIFIHLFLFNQLFFIRLMTQPCSDHYQKYLFQFLYQSRKNKISWQLGIISAYEKYIFLEITKRYILFSIVSTSQEKKKKLATWHHMYNVMQVRESIYFWITKRYIFLIFHQSRKKKSWRLGILSTYEKYFSCKEDFLFGQFRRRVFEFFTRCGLYVRKFGCG